jgi:hypothetical protein
MASMMGARRLRDLDSHRATGVPRTNRSAVVIIASSRVRRTGPQSIIAGYSAFGPAGRPHISRLSKESARLALTFRAIPKALRRLEVAWLWSSAWSELTSVGLDVQKRGAVDAVETLDDEI